jgi:hypothetical protein
MNELEALPLHVINPPAIVVQAFDEQQAKREWDEACADEEDATERKVAVLRAALKRWPMILSSNPGRRARGLMSHHPDMRRFVRDVLGMRDCNGNCMNTYAGALLKHGADIRRRRQQEHNRNVTNIRQLRYEVKDGVKAYRLGRITGDEFAQRLAKFYEETVSVKA